MMKLVILSCLVAAACGSGLIAPYAPFAYTAAPYFGYSSFGYPGYASNYRGPLSLAPGQPASILGADGRPLDTLDVNLDKSAHYTAKALEGSGIHLLKKRSAALIAPIAAAPIAALPYAGAYASPYTPYSGYGYTGFNGYTGYNGYAGYSAPFAYYKK